jgi:hypothetical protein
VDPDVKRLNSVHAVCTCVDTERHIDNTRPRGAPLVGQIAFFRSIDISHVIPLTLFRILHVDISSGRPSSGVVPLFKGEVLSLTDKAEGP